MSRDPFFDAIRERLLPDATNTEIENLFARYLSAQPEPAFIAHIAGDQPRHPGVAAIRTTPTRHLPQPPTERTHRRSGTGTSGFLPTPP